MTDPIIDIRELSYSYGHGEVLEGVDLQVPRGCVCGLVGENGVGKTTLMKMLIGRLLPQAGSVRVFGCDPAREPEAVLGRTGYLAEDRDMPTWMKVGEFIGYMQAFYPSWEEAYAENLRDAFRLPNESAVRALSRGQSARLGLLVALAHRPPLLLLDEPSSGLDAVVRRDILTAVIRVAADEGRTVFFSSHLLDELQRVSDRVAILREGRIAMEGSIEQMLRSHCQVSVTWNDEPESWWHEVDALLIEKHSREWRILISSSHLDALRRVIAMRQGRITEETPPSLEELFVAVAGTNNDEIS